MKKELIQKCEKMAMLFDTEFLEVTKEACRGKYAGTYDYSIRFKNGVVMSICNGFRYFESSINEKIKIYEEFKSNKDFILETLKSESIDDNKLADILGFNKYNILDVDFSKVGNSYLGWFFLKLELENGAIIDFIETGLQYRIEKMAIGEYKTDRRSRYFVAGGLKDEEVDFIFNYVGHGSKSHLYKLAA